VAQHQDRLRVIPAVSSCPRCLIDVFPLDPQPKWFSKGYRARDKSKWMKSRYSFECPAQGCGTTWSVKEDEAEAHYDFLVKAGLLGARG
jgi:hypothetical protein